ncbi:MAG: hypothetical protein H6553_04680 [Chitinophagales bacterium]|nr:hypothetical protein [Chitinophagales bacterium]
MKKTKIVQQIKKLYQLLGYSFPIQLLLLHIKKYLFFTIIWVLFFSVVSGTFMEKYGAQLLLLDPEYLGEVGFLSFFIIGLGMGGFIMAWNVCFYILNSYRFEFLASVSKPFVRFCFNNIIIPIAFTITYLVMLIKFYHQQEINDLKILLLNIAGLCLGNLVMIIVYTIYFIYINDDIETFLEKLSEKSKNNLLLKNIKLEKLSLDTEFEQSDQWSVSSYWHYPWKINRLQRQSFYDKNLVQRVMLLHHRNAFVIILVSIAILIVLGSLIENPIFRIPAGASFMMLATVFMVFMTFITFWFRGWSFVAVIILIALLNFLSKYNLVVYNHKLAGLKYETPLNYGNEELDQSISRASINKDILYTTKILNRWKRKNRANHKPKLILLNCAGGGLKASYWTFLVLQELDKLTKQQFFKHTSLISGASGGMLGAAYYRELNNLSLHNDSINVLNENYLNNIGKDILNGIASSIAMNDVFYPWRKFEYNGEKYNKDRAYMFDLCFNENTNFLLNKSISDYKEAEQKAEIPMMILASTIANDQRLALMSPHNISFMVKPYLLTNQNTDDYISPDCYDFRNYFSSVGADSVNFVSALRMNATYPYILPSVYLPTNPSTKALDAGIRDNFGWLVSSRFLSAFSDWVDENTSGVIFVVVKVDDKLKSLKKDTKSSYMDELTSPLGSIFSNMMVLQNYNSDQVLATLDNMIEQDITVLDFTYKPSAANKKASMTFHLTNQEKKNIQEAFNNEDNQYNAMKLKGLLLE